MGWIGVVEKLSEANRINREKRILEWEEIAGKPHAKITLGDHPDYMDTIGFWRIKGGLLRIRASKRGSFDPQEGTEITDKEIAAIAKTRGYVEVGNEFRYDNNDESER